ncbi:MAG: S1C family serine protease [Pirellulaceae bacterium]|nr:S1C family serine protease [Pirellulaceae bacterium]
MSFPIRKYKNKRDIVVAAGNQSFLVKKGGAFGRVILSCALAISLASGSWSQHLLHAEKLAEDSQRYASDEVPSLPPLQTKQKDDDKVEKKGPLPRPERDESALADDSRLNKILLGGSPENTDDLVKMQGHVKKMVKEVMPAVVGVRVGGSSGSGVIVSEDGIVLTAGHVVKEPGTKVTFIFPDGSQKEGVSLGMNSGVDSGMMKITDKGKYPFRKMGHSSQLEPGQWLFAMGHPGGYEEGRTPPLRLGRLLVKTKSTLMTDCTLVGGDSGGPLFDMEGNVIGINSRIGPVITANMHVPVDVFYSTWDRLSSGESWGSLADLQKRFEREKKQKEEKSGPSKENKKEEKKDSQAIPKAKPYVGMASDPDADYALIDEVLDGSPAAKAGLKPGDVIVSFDGNLVTDFEGLAEMIAQTSPGDRVVVGLLRKKRVLKMTLVIGENKE